jgi:hypothetical protein
MDFVFLALVAVLTVGSVGLVYLCGRLMQTKETRS